MSISSSSAGKRLLGLWHVPTDLSKIVSFGAAEAAARALNWGTMLLLPFVLHSSEAYGRVGLLVSIEMTAASILCMGLDRAVLRFYGQHDAHRTLLRSMMTIWGAVAWLPLPALLLMHLAGYESFFGIPLAPDMLLLTLCIAVFNLNAICVSLSRAQQLLSKNLRFRVLYVATRSALVLLLACWLGSSTSFVVAATVASITMLFLIVPFLQEQTGSQTDWPLVRRLLLFGTPFVFHNIGGTMFGHFSRFFLQAQASVAEVGLFTFACTVGNAVFFLYSALATFFEPKIYSFAGDKDSNERWLCYFTNTAVALAAVGSAQLLLVYPYLVSRLPGEYDKALICIHLIVGSMMLQPLYLQGSYRLATYKKTIHIANATLLGGAFNVLLSFLLIPSYGIWGAALALYIATFVQCGYAFVVSLHVGRTSWQCCNLGLTSIVCVLGAIWVALANHAGVATLGLLAVFMLAVRILYQTSSNTA